MLSIENRLNFLAELDLAEPTRELLTTSKRVRAEVNEDDPSGNVAAGSLVSFVAGVSGQNRRDVLNSTLLAQLAASKKYNRYEQADDWYKFYLHVLENIGWSAQGWDFKKYNASGATVTLSKVVLEILAAIATQDELAVITKSIEALKSLDQGDGTLTLFNQQSQKDKRGSFQIGIASEYNEAVALRVGGFHFTSKEYKTNFLFWSFSSSDIELFTGTEELTLNSEVYAMIREKVLEKLGASADDFIDSLW